MKVFVIPLLGIMFITFITSFIPHITADAPVGNDISFEDADKLNAVTTKDSKYEIYLHVLVRNAQDKLISIAETLPCQSGNYCSEYFDHEVTDYAFDSLGKKEIVTIDNIKYEKIQYILTPTLEERTIGYYPIFSELTVQFEVGENVYTKMNEETKDYSIWKIHYCAEFDGHGYRCIPIFQVLMPTLTLEPSDIPTQQWTILREIN